ncbi:MAG: hypothetical protein LQ352_007176 [Teloschistes flavicans]|nr:MAG: hypothetical protein LQ352_007176 [Teloschistes flavicans]
MAGPNHGALGSTFKVMRVLQALSLLAIIGMAANFISQMIQHNNAPSEVLVGTLSVQRRRQSAVRQLDRSEQDYMLRDEGNLGVEHRIVVSVPTPRQQCALN